MTSFEVLVFMVRERRERPQCQHLWRQSGETFLGGNYLRHNFITSSKYFFQLKLKLKS